MSRSSSSEINEDYYAVAKNGINFKLKKRTYKEMIGDKTKQNSINNTSISIIDNNANANVNTNTQVNVQMKENNNDEVDNDNDNNEDEDDVDKEYNIKPKTKHNNNNNDKDSPSRADNTISNAINHNNNESNFHLKASIIPALPSQRSTILFKEAERFKTSLAKFALHFKTEKMPKLITILTKVTIKSLAKKTISCEVLNLCKNIDFALTRSYPNETSPINLELAFYDLLLDKNELYNNILIGESNTRLTNLLLYYFSQINIINMGNALSPFIDYSMDKFKQLPRLPFKSTDNIMNVTLANTANTLFNLFKLSKAKLPKHDSQSKLSKEFRSNFFNKCFNEMFKTKTYQTIAAVSLFDFDSLNYLFQANSSFFHNQLTQLAIYPRIIQTAHDYAYQYKARLLKAHFVKNNKDRAYGRLVSMILKPFEIYYINTMELIMDFLEDDE